MGNFRGCFDVILSRTFGVRQKHPTTTISTHAKKVENVELRHPTPEMMNVCLPQVRNDLSTRVASDRNGHSDNLKRTYTHSPQLEKLIGD